MKTLETLVLENTEFQELGFSIHIHKDVDHWHACLEKLGHEEGYKQMADVICNRYKELYGEEFLFSNECVAYEIGYHTDCYMYLKGYPHYEKRIAAFILPKTRVLSACAIIDIYTSDCHVFAQRFMFHYKSGIREIYKGTSKDPFKR